MESAGIGFYVGSENNLKELNIYDPKDEGTLIGIGRQSGLQIQCGIRYPAPEYLDSNFTLTSGQFLVFVDAGTGGVTVTLPEVTSGGQFGRWYQIFKLAGSGNVTVSPDGSELINGANASKTISSQFAGLQLFCDELSNGWVATVLTAA